MDEQTTVEEQPEEITKEESLPENENNESISASKDQNADDVMQNSDGIAQQEDNGAPKKKGIKALVEYIKTHEDLRQMVLFLLFSFLCAAAQTITQFVLKYAIGAIKADPFDWFLFHYPQERGLAEFIGFICGAIIGQVMTFILNRKKTFKATNNVIVAGIMYAIIAICIILLQTYLGGVITKACENAAVANGTDTSGFIGFLITLTGMAVGGICALVLSFLGNKYLVMRDWGKKKAQENE